MKFLIDAQLPRRLTYGFREAGHDALHTLDLPKGNGTTDTEINEISVREQRVVVTKDSDFVDSFLLFGRPHKLLLISTGNIKNAGLEAILASEIQTIAAGFDSCDYIELTRTTLVFHS